jgi:hypothetical protein
MTKAELNEALDEPRFQSGELSLWTREAKVALVRHEHAERKKSAAMSAEQNAIKALTRRVVQVERMVDALPEAMAATMLDWIDAELHKRCLLEYRGLYDEAVKYRRGHTVTAGNAVWTCVADAAPGERPSKSPSWRLIAKASLPPSHGANT